MRKAINEYGRILIVMIVFGILCALLFGNQWFHLIGKGADEMMPDAKLNQYEDADAPVIYAQDQRISVDTPIYLGDIYTAQTGAGVDISDKVNIFCDKKVYNSATKTFESSETGMFTVTFKVVDDTDGHYLSATKQINIFVDKSTGAHWIKVKPSMGGTIAVNGTMFQKDQTVSFTATPDTGYLYDGAKIIYNNTVHEALDKNTTSFKMPNANVTIEPIWKAEVYTVVLNTNGGQCNIKEILVEYGSCYINLPVDITKSGCKFLGWYTADEGGTKVEINTKVTTASTHVLYAHWGFETYTLTLNPDGGDCFKNSVTVCYNNKIGNLPTPTKRGYDFAGWYTDDSAAKLVTSDTVYDKSSDSAVIAHWTPSQILIKFNPTGGMCAIQSKEYAYASVYSVLPTPVKKGFTFDGWYTDPDEGVLISETDAVAFTSTTTLYAHWASGSVVITFDTNGGNSSIKYKNVLHGSIVGSLPTATKIGFDFLGWFSGLTDGDHITENYKVTSTSDFTVYAHWSAKTYTVSFDTAGGNIPVGESVQITSKNVKFNNLYGILPTPIKNGYVFTGWKLETADGITINKDSIVATPHNHKLVASWSADARTITFDANGGECTTATRKITTGSTYGALPTATKSGFVFGGWYTAQIGGSKIDENTIYTLNTDQTLYARWETTTVAYVQDRDAATILATSVGDTDFSEERAATINGSVCYAVHDSHSILGANSEYIDTEVKQYINSIVIGKDVTEIANEAFLGCSNISGTIILPSELTRIGESAFRNCSSISKIVLGDNVEEIGAAAFKSCSKLEEINIPNKITALSSEIFNYCTSLENITISHSLRTIGGKAFMQCSALRKIEMPNTLVSIGEYAFSNCIAIESISIPDNVTSIGKGSFANCESATTLTMPITLQVEDSSVFDQCNMLNKFIFTKGLDGNSADYKDASEPTEGLTDYAITPWNRVNDIDVIVGSGVKTIGTRFFSHSSINSISLPESLLKISKHAFDGSLLTEIVLPKNIENVDEYAFYRCGALTDITLPITCEYNKVGTFEEDASLVNVHLTYGKDGRGVNYSTSSVSYTPWYANYYINPLNISFDDTVTEIGNCTFYGCDEDFASLVLPKNLVKIGAGAFSDSGIPNIVIPSSVTYIGSSAFRDCWNLTSVDLSNVSTIGERAFYGSGLTSVTLNENATLIGGGAFSNISTLRTVICPSGGKYVYENGYIYGDGVLVSYLSNNISKTFTVPSNITEIGAYCFVNTKLETINLPDTISKINEGSFYKNLLLYKVMGLVYSNNISEIPDYAFAYCEKLANFGDDEGFFMISGSIASIGKCAFINCDAIIGFILNNFEETTIDEQAFAYCDNLYSVFILNTVTTINADRYYDSPFAGIDERILVIYCEFAEDDIPSGYQQYWNAKGEGATYNTVYEATVEQAVERWLAASSGDIQV